MQVNKKNLLNWLGLLGIVSFLSYTAAVVFAPLAYPDYNWLSQAVSDLSAVNSPSLILWNQLAILYELCGIVSITAVCIAVQGKLNKPIRYGIYIFAVMNWISGIGYAMFPLSDSGYAGEFIDFMHILVTVLVMLLSIVSLVLIIAGGYRKKYFTSLAVWATAALSMMFIGAIGVNAVPQAYFGVFQRFVLFAATGFNAVLGIYLFKSKFVEKVT